jgi:hypothetical protein
MGHASKVSRWYVEGTYVPPILRNWIDDFEYATDVAASNAYPKGPTYCSVTPIMTDNGHPTNYLATGIASGDSVATRTNYYWAFDNTESTEWVTYQTSYANLTRTWLRIDLGTNMLKNVAKYAIYSRGSVQSSPKSWSLVGSNVTGVGTILDTKTDQLDWYTDKKLGGYGYETREYLLSNTNRFRYFHLKITKPQTYVNESPSYMGIKDLVLYENKSNTAMNIYSSSSVKTQGNYSLRCDISSTMTNCSIIRTFTPTNLSSASSLTFNTLSMRLGNTYNVSLINSSMSYVDVTTNMTTNSLPSPCVVSGNYLAGFGTDPFRAFDGFRWTPQGSTAAAKSFSSTSSNSWIKYDYGAGKSNIICAYDVILANAQTTPHSWELYGSNTASSEVLLDSRSGETNNMSFDGSYYTLWPVRYKFSNATAYRSYRLTIRRATLNVGLWEVRWLAASTNEDTVLWTCPVNITATNTWQTFTTNISSISTSNRSAVYKIEIKNKDASANNTFYLDNLYWE